MKLDLKRRFSVYYHPVIFLMHRKQWSATEPSSMNQLYMIMQILAHGLSEGVAMLIRELHLYGRIFLKKTSDRKSTTQGLKRFKGLLQTVLLKGVRHQRAELQTEAVLRRFSN